MSALSRKDRREAIQQYAADRRAARVTRMSLVGPAAPAKRPPLRLGLCPTGCGTVAPITPEGQAMCGRCASEVAGLLEGSLEPAAALPRPQPPSSRLALAIGVLILSGVAAASYLTAVEESRAVQRADDAGVRFEGQ